MAVSREEFEQLQEKIQDIQENLSLLANEDLLTQIEEARKRRNEGEGVSLSDVKEALDE